MAENSKIQWTDHTASPWYGCTNAVLPDGSPHPGCEHCYAESMAKRNPSTLGKWGDDGYRVLSKSFATNCRRWNKQAEKAGVRKKVFPSICDPFEDFKGPIQNKDGQRLTWDPSSGGYLNLDMHIGKHLATLEHLRADLFAVSDECPWLDFLLLTKRPQNIWSMWPKEQCCDCHAADVRGIVCGACDGTGTVQVPRNNVWLGTSVSNQATADAMIPELLKCLAFSPVLFLSVEPLLGPVNLNTFTGIELASPSERIAMGQVFPHGLPDDSFNAQFAQQMRAYNRSATWVIAGGESGPGARPMHPDWVRGVRDQCVAAGVPFFFKQWGEWAPVPQSQLDKPNEVPGPISIPLTDRIRKSVVLRPDGSRSDVMPNGQEPRNWWMIPCGKAISGRLLDGVEWSEFPHHVEVPA